MKKGFWIFIVIALILLACVGFYLFSKNNHQANNYDASRTSTNFGSNINSSNDNNVANNNQSNDDNSINETNINKGITEATTPNYKEEQIATFSTKIYSKDSARQNNIQITCNTLNGTIVENGSTFSFCNTVGPSTSSKGYQEADIFDSNGKKKKGLGGGNCQISTTLYNAVLSVPSLVVTERHEHSNYVPYIKDGKDAAVAYGSYDLKFRNNLGNPLKIIAQASTDNVTINLISLIPS